MFGKVFDDSGDFPNPSVNLQQHFFHRTTLESGPQKQLRTYLGVLAVEIP